MIMRDPHTGQVIRDPNGFCVKAAPGCPGILVCEINESTSFDGYTDAAQSQKKVLRV